MSKSVDNDRVSLPSDEEAKILKEVEELGRLTPDQELILYNLTLKQDELGRQQTNVMLDQLEDNDLYIPLLEREYLTYEIYNHGTKHEIASLYVTLKGTRYCIVYADEISKTRKLNPAGAPWEESEKYQTASCESDNETVSDDD